MNRTLAVVLGMVFIFAVSASILLYVMPSPHKPTDYLVTGAIGTLLCLVLLYFILTKAVKGSGGRPDSES